MANTDRLAARRHSVTSMRSVSAIGPMRVSQSNDAPTPAVGPRQEANRDGVLHPLDMSAEVAHDLPHLVARRVDLGAHAAHPASRLGYTDAVRSCAAANSGGVMLIITPVPRSKPATLTSFGQMWACQWNWRLWRNGAVWTTTLYATITELIAQHAHRIAQHDARWTSSSASGVAVRCAS